MKGNRDQNKNKRPRGIYPVKGMGEVDMRNKSAMRDGGFTIAKSSRQVVNQQEREFLHDGRF
jgi:hypothetical protein